jgi:hypothetical protein
MRVTGRAAALLLALLSAAPIACRSPAPTRVPAHELRERHREIRVGESLAQVHARMGALPVPRPGHPDAPFPTPYRVTSFRTPGGDTVRLEVYVVAVRPADGCPDVQYEDAPVAYLNRRVAALSWDDLEWRWRAWGGDLGVLRALQDRFVCDREGLPEPPEAPGAAR